MPFCLPPCPECGDRMDLTANGTLAPCGSCGKIMSVIAAMSRQETPVKEGPALAGEYASPAARFIQAQDDEALESLNVMPHLPVEDCEAIGDRIKVRILKLPEVIEDSAIIRPETVVGVPFQGLVLSTGRGVISNGVLFPLEVQVGDIVHFQKYGGHEIEVGGKAVMMLRENEVQLRTPRVKWELALLRAKAKAAEEASRPDCAECGNPLDLNASRTLVHCESCAARAKAGSPPEAE